MSELAEKIYRIIGQHFGIANENLSPTLNFVEDLGADSLDTVELVAALEKELEIGISDADMHHFDTVENIVDFIQSKRL